MRTFKSLMVWSRKKDIFRRKQRLKEFIEDYYIKRNTELIVSCAVVLFWVYNFSPTQSHKQT